MSEEGRDPQSPVSGGIQNVHHDSYTSYERTFRPTGRLYAHFHFPTNDERTSDVGHRNVSSYLSLRLFANPCKPHPDDALAVLHTSRRQQPSTPRSRYSITLRLFLCHAFTRVTSRLPPRERNLLTRPRRTMRVMMAVWWRYLPWRDKEIPTRNLLAGSNPPRCSYLDGKPTLYAVTPRVKPFQLLGS